MGGGQRHGCNSGTVGGGGQRRGCNSGTVGGGGRDTVGAVARWGVGRDTVVTVARWGGAETRWEPWHGGGGGGQRHDGSSASGTRHDTTRQDIFCIMTNFVSLKICHFDWGVQFFVPGKDNVVVQLNVVGRIWAGKEEGGRNLKVAPCLKRIQSCRRYHLGFWADSSTLLCTCEKRTHCCTVYTGGGHARRCGTLWQMSYVCRSVSSGANGGL